MAGYTTADLLMSAKVRGMLPDASSGSLSPDNLLMMATEELHNLMVPMILAAREKYYETFKDFAAVAGQDTYDIPERAIGGVLSAVQYVYGINILPLTPIPPADITTTTQALSPKGYYFQNNSIVLYPSPSADNFTVRMRYFQRPSRLTLVTNCAQISAVDTVLNQVTVSSIPGTWATGAVVDFISATIPYTPFGLDSVVTGVTGTTVSFAAIPTTAKVGDWLSLAGMTPLPELPYEMFPVLSQATACKALESLGDAQGLAAAQAKLQINVSNALKLITPRDQGSPKKVRSNWRNL